MAIYTETNLTLKEFADEVVDAKGLDIDSEDRQFIAEVMDAADERLTTTFDDYPCFYYFKDIAGKSYVCEENGSCSIVCEVTELDDGINNVCRDYLESTVYQWDGDSNEILAIYRLPAQLTPANPTDEQVRVWVEYEYSLSSANAPLDSYLKDENYEQQVFATYQEAQDWINEQYSKDYVLANGEMGRPTYTVVN